MQIATDDMVQLAADPAEEALVVLDDSLPVIDAALVHFYGYEQAEAEAFKDTLSVWFHRVIRRAGSPARDLAHLREQLLFVACKYAAAFRLAQARTGGVLDERWSLAAHRSPEEVAMAMLHQIRPEGADA